MIVSTAIPRIGSDFNELDNAVWIVTAYVLAFDAFQPIYGKLADIFGRKVTLLFSIAIFLTGSLLCGIASNLIMLVIFRAFQGMGGSGVLALVLITVADVVPLRERGKYMGIINGVFGISSVLGPLIGIFFTDHISWKWAFFINLPIGAVTVIIIIFYLKTPTPEGSFMGKLKRIDFAGTILILSFATLLLLALNFGGVTYPWMSVPVIACIVASVLLIVVLAFVEFRRAVEPVIPARLFKSRNISATYVAQWFFGMTFNGVLIEMPLFLQVSTEQNGQYDQSIRWNHALSTLIHFFHHQKAVRGDSATVSGLRIILLEVGICSSGVLVGYLISRFNNYRIL
ncbi:major facilitator superfamily domain-containing protein [Jimgerdemannia flammicorona]|uniref:Major facilitator superfamily domain-containing protein n=2 Tax=Jimgerdemannia flammicorona TaxID=994334 RepID=A0A433QTI4_9FUNG|nr:major facilitator superfamily domain-containing protein [Jimgerdemannia flammicorona]RUS33102.1 major facilitator superfamily domain-containing protein [Jimgerdemannia flammicorona]